MIIFDNMLLIINKYQLAVECTENCSNGTSELHLVSQTGNFLQNHQEIVQLSCQSQIFNFH